MLGAWPGAGRKAIYPACRLDSRRFAIPRLVEQFLIVRDDLGTPLYRVQSAINERLGKSGYVYAGVDHFEHVIRSILE